tara:strand:+ start:650 stop:1087 length:438 start_codon:yes stop_codon:yes gene_type:complete
MTSKIKILPDQFVFKQGDKGDAAYLVISGSFNVERNGEKVGKITEGEIFGELSLILGEERKASIKAVTPSEIVEIKPAALNELLLSSSLELHKLIKEFSIELAKNSDFNLPISNEDLKKLVKNEPNIIRALALQLHYRLSQMIYS